MRIAITGHRGLPEPTVTLVTTAIRQWLAEHTDTDLTGLTFLADGADSIFAQAVVDASGSLVVVVPAAEYRDGLPAEHHPVYDALISRAVEVVRLDRQESTSQSHMDASVYMLGRADLLLAVWDGEPARGYGGTADVVDAAKQRGVAVTVIWPNGASRD